MSLPDSCEIDNLSRYLRGTALAGLPAMKTLGKFEILEKLGQGAMGVVYKARDPLIGRLVALKTITTGLAEDPSLLERFYREAHSAGALQHPNIVTIYELGEADKTPFIAMEYLNGSSLDKLVKSRQTLPLSQKVGYIAYLCRALAYAHKQGVVHRDIKPGNVMVTSDGTVKVVDFGIARIAENSKSQSGLLIGTLGYMSPQQLEGRRADAKSDIWAAGILFYELLAHRRPFDGDNYGALMLNIMTQTMPPLSEAAPGTPPDVAAVVERMLRKDPDERFQSMEEALIDLEPVWRGLQRSEASDLIEASRKMLKAGDVSRAYETVRRVLQIDTANAQAKDLSGTDQCGDPPEPDSSPGSERIRKDDETLIGPAADAIRSSRFICSSDLPLHERRAALFASVRRYDQSASSARGHNGPLLPKPRCRLPAAGSCRRAEMDAAHADGLAASGSDGRRWRDLLLCVSTARRANFRDECRTSRKPCTCLDALFRVRTVECRSCRSGTGFRKRRVTGCGQSAARSHRQNPAGTNGPVHDSASNVAANKSDSDQLLFPNRRRRGTRAGTGKQQLLRHQVALK